jgi:SAM-dependent methyltransferase
MDLLLNNHQTRGLHSLRFLSALDDHPEMMESIGTVLDIESGIGLDSEWWATRVDKDQENPKPLEIDVTACSRSDEMKQEVKDMDRVNYIRTTKNFWEQFQGEQKFDVLWCHGVLHKYNNFYETLNQMNTLQDKDGLLCITVPRINNVFYGDPDYRVYSDCHTDINIVNLIYGLALAGYDCRDAFFLQEKNSNLVNAIVYKNSDNTYGINEVTPYDLMEMDRLPNSMITQLNKFGYISNKNLLLSWIDGTLIDYSTV